MRNAEKKRCFCAWELANLNLSHPLQFLEGGKGTTIAVEVSVRRPNGASRKVAD